MSLPVPPPPATTSPLLDGEMRGGATAAAAAAAPVTVQVHALSAGYFSLPEEQFVHPSSHAARSTVPSLCFLVQHFNPVTGNNTNIVFDLGLRRDINRYAEPIRRHVATRQPMTTDPDVVKSLNRGGLTPDDIDYVIYSHVSHVYENYVPLPPFPSFPPLLL